jgi:hypothetical protein
VYRHCATELIPHILQWKCFVQLGRWAPFQKILEWMTTDSSAPVHHWAEEKPPSGPLRQVVLSGMKNKWDQQVYIDLYAGGLQLCPGTRTF